MLWTVIALLVVLWVIGLAFKIATGIIHILLLIAVALILLKVIGGRKTQV